MKCKHENADHLKPGDWWTCGQRLAPSLIIAEQFRCINCGSWLSLGPANDSPPAVRIEILGARFAADYDRPSKAGPCPLGECDVCQARYLAEEIRS